MRLLFITMLLNVLIMTAHASESIGHISNSAGKIQIKTIKAKRLEGIPGTQINVGDFLKVRKKSMAIIAMQDGSKFQISEKTTLVFDDFLYDETNQKMLVRIIDGALSYDGKKIAPNSNRQFNTKGFTLTVRGTKFAGKFGSTSQIVLLKGAVELSGKGKSQVLLGSSMQSIIFDASGMGKPFNMSIIEVKSFFVKHGLNFDLLMGPKFEQNIESSNKNCVGSNCGN